MPRLVPRASSNGGELTPLKFDRPGPSQHTPGRVGNHPLPGSWRDFTALTTQLAAQ